MAKTASIMPCFSLPMVEGPLVPMNCFTSFAWSGNIESLGGGDFESNKTAAKISEVIRAKDPGFDKGMSPGDVG